MTETTPEQLAALEGRLAAQPSSPLFARVASIYLEQGRVEEALRLCDDGLARYPYYTTAHLVRGRILQRLDRLVEARAEFETVQRALPTNPLVAQLVSNLPLPETEATLPPGPVVAPPFEQPSPLVEEELSAIAQEESRAEVIVPEEPSEFGGIGAPFVAEESTPSGEAETAQPIAEEPSSPTTGFGEEAEPSIQEERISTYDETDPFAALRPEGGEASGKFETPAAVEQAPADQPSKVTPDYFEAFSQLQQAAQEVPAETPPAEEDATTENPFEAFSGGGEELPTPSMPTAEESYDEFAARIRMELFGTENTMTLEEYLARPSDDPTPTTPSNHIEELAEKLKTPTKITPVINFSEKETKKASEAETDAGTGFVTPTLAEIYAKQGWYDDAIKAYRTLAINKPSEKEKYEKRIAELEELKKQQRLS
jgi:tetratricopeptide (TPR) repeat protein